MSSTTAILNSKAKHTATMIFVHGLRESGHKWVKKLETIRPDYLKIVCPTGNFGFGCFNCAIEITRKYLLCKYILGSGAPGTPGVNP